MNQLTKVTLFIFTSIILSSCGKSKSVEITRYKSGDILSKTISKNDKVTTEYVWYKNGNIKSEKNFAGGGHYSWFENGQIRSINKNTPKGLEIKKFYSNGQISEFERSNKVEHWYKNGNIKYLREGDKVLKAWFENGQIKSIRKRNLFYNEWYRNGQIRSMHDVTRFYDEEPLKIFLGYETSHYALDDFYSIVQTDAWYNNGQKQLENIYDTDGQYIGSYTFYKNGQIRYEFLPLQKIEHLWNKDGSEIKIEYSTF